MLKFSKANAKTQALKNDSELADYLTRQPQNLFVRFT